MAARPGDPVSYSRAEVSAALLKAARAAGVPLAQAEDASLAFVDDVSLFLELLAEPPRAFTHAGAHLHGGRCLWDGPGALDLCQLQVVTWTDPPNAAGLTRLAAYAGAAVTQTGDDLTLSKSAPVTQAYQRVQMEPATWDALDRAAAKIYVPNSEQSRAGAGTGA